MILVWLLKTSGKLELIDVKKKARKRREWKIDYRAQFT
jgi:hypothetical protein